MKRFIDLGTYIEIAINALEEGLFPVWRAWTMEYREQYLV